MDVVPSDVEFLQGEIQAFITNETLALTTNGDRSAVHYSVTTAPKFGGLWLDFTPVTTFSQSDVDAGRLSYIQSNLTSAFDEFIMDVRDSAQNEIRDVEVDVIVKARVNIRDETISVSGDEPFYITVDLLDASDLASLTGDDPLYNVFILPRFGTLNVAEQQRRRRRDDWVKWRRTARRRRRKDSNEDELDSSFVAAKVIFSHEDVVNNRVTYSVNPNVTRADGEDGPQSDVFNFTLLAPNTQPAVGSLQLEVSLPPATAAPPVDDDDDDEYVYVYDAEDVEDDGKEYVTTALIVAGGVLTSICSIVAYRCYRLGRRRRWKRRQRELEALRPEDEPKQVERHAADLHPSEPLLTRSAWTEPMHVAKSEAEMRRLRAEHWQSRRRLNDALRCTAVDSTTDQQPQGDNGLDQTLLRQSRFQSPPNTSESPEHAWLDRFGRTQQSSTGDDTEDGQTEGQRERPALSHVTSPPSKTPPTCQSTQLTHTDTLLSWLDRPPTAPSPDHPQRSTSPTSKDQSYPARDDRTTSEVPAGLFGPTAARLPQLPVRYPHGPVDTERYSADRQTSSVDQQQHQHQDPLRPPPGHSSVPYPRPTPGPSDLLRSTMAQPPVAGGGAPRRDRVAHAQSRQRGDDACADGSHCGTSTTTPEMSVTARTAPYDDDVGYVTGSRAEQQVDDRGRHGDEAAHQVVYDWDKVDPQLIDLCRKTSPVLDKNQYWV